MKELQDALRNVLVNTRIEVLDWHTCQTHEELTRWREVVDRLIAAARAMGRAEASDPR